MHEKLPHISLEHHYQFITFRTYKSIDSYIQRVQQAEIETKKKEYLIDEYLDTSSKGAYFFGEQIMLMKDILYSKNHTLYTIEICAIMPNHIHILLQQHASLEKIVKYIKGRSAIEMNKKLNLKGQFWHRNYFDKLIRNEKHFNLVYEYIQNNPLKAHLKDAKRVFSAYE
ncbi:MAG: transposase [Arcobacteraceae bacterium]|jgi:REP element-mobilizing transposase RayT|nr:transposase [Arcobacteraceae bacterium]